MMCGGLDDISETTSLWKNETNLYNYEAMLSLSAFVL